MLDLNRGSGFVYRSASAVSATGMRINELIDAALVAANRTHPSRDYLGVSRIGEPCARKLTYEVTHTPKDEGQDVDGFVLRIFDAGLATGSKSFPSAGSAPPDSICGPSAGTGANSGSQRPTDESAATSTA